MDKHAAIQKLLDQRIIAIIRAGSGGDDLVTVVEAIAAGGISCIEVTMNTPGVLDCIATASQRLAGTEVLLGAGTVLDAESCRMAIVAGAAFIVTPVVSVPAIRTAHRYGAPICCGAYTPTEIFTAWEEGADLVKVFPASLGGPAYLKAIKGPLPQIPLVPVGGVGIDNAGAFLDAGAAAVAVGGTLVTRSLLAERNFEAITANARAFAATVAAHKPAI